MRIGLRWKILLLAVLTPATLGVAALLTVSRNVRAHVDSSSIHESLQHSVLVFESMLHTRSRALAGGARVIARDPRFFSLLMLGPGQRDSRFTATVKEMAHDFNAIAQTDLFEVFDRHGRRLASVGAVSSTPGARERLVSEALTGATVEGILVERDAHYQVALTPVLADQRIVGVLLLGSAIGPALAHELRAQMRCEVTFLSGHTITGTTLDSHGDRAALLGALTPLHAEDGRDLGDDPVRQVHAPDAVYLTVVRRLPGSAPAPPQLYVMQRSYDPETSFLGVMRRDMAVLAWLAVGLSLLTGLLFSEAILRPLQRLVRGAQEMEKGNYEFPLNVRRGDEIGYLATRFDEMRRRERAYLESLEQAARLKSRFLDAASHELRTPLSVLIGYHDLFADGTLGALDPRQRQALDTMRAQLARMTRLADDTARFARIRGERLQLDVKPHALAPIVQRAVRSARAAGADRAVTIEELPGGPAEPIEVDGDGLEHAIQQLVANAIRFTPDGGRVEVRTLERDGRVRIEVCDHGVGIAEDRLPGVLAGEPPAGADAPNYAGGLAFNTSGLGIGLSIARAMIEAHGGTLSATSRLGEGSTFVLELPARLDASQRAAA